MAFTADLVRKDFPILEEKVYKKPFIYFDNGATVQKPKQVIEVLDKFYLHQNSNIHRGVHYFSDLATNMYEESRKTVQKYINAAKTSEIIFTKGTTESINTVAFSFGEKYVKAGDEILISEMEHHANIVPWQMLCERKQAVLKVIPFHDSGDLDLIAFEKLLSEKTKLLAVTHVSNALGTVNPIKFLIEKAHKKNIPVLIDAAQSIQHIAINIQELDCDFLVFSGHKMYAPTGIGVLYGKEKFLEEMPPFMGGGDMVDKVTFEKTTYNQLPLKFEAGTPPFAEAIALKAAIDYINSFGLNEIHEYENQLNTYARKKIQEVGDITIYGNAKESSGVISFLLNNIHGFDTGMVLDKMGIAVRTGTHCAQPVMQHYNIPGTARASLAMYNTHEEIDKLCEALKKVREMFG